MKTLLLNIFLIIGLLSSDVLTAQSIRKREKVADEFFERLDYLNALIQYQAIVELDTSRTYNFYRAGLCQFNLGKRDINTLNYFQKAASDNTDAHYYIGRIYHFDNKLEEALKEFIYAEENFHINAEVTLEELQRWITICKSSIEYELNANDIIVTKLGSEVNTHYPEYAPFLSKDERMMVFTSRREGSSSNIKDAYGNYLEDIYFCERKDSTWTQAKAFDNKINSITHDAGVTFTNDTTMIIYRTDAKQTGGDLYSSILKNNTWQTPKMITKRINSEHQEPSATYSIDGDVIIFSSNKPGGFGGKDLYRIIRFSDSLYSLPFNLGPTINSPYDEDAPYLTSDKKELYYSTKGKGSMGGYDIFKADLDENYKPANSANMGMPINSTADDIYFVLNNTGETGLFSSNRSGDHDIYEVEINNRNYIVVKGKVEVTTGKKINLGDIQISVTENESGKVNGVYKLKTNYNSFILLVNKTKHYSVKVESPEIETFEEVMQFNGKDIQLNLSPLKK